MSKVLWSKKQKEDFDEWAAHFETYQKWLSKKPQEHQLFNMSVKNIKRNCSVEYYRGFLESIAHMIAAIQNSLESAEAIKDIGVVKLKQTFSEYCHVLLGYLDEKNKIKNNHQQKDEKEEEDEEEEEDDEEEEEEVEEKDTSLLTTAQRAVPLRKSKEFYVGFRDGCEQMSRLVTTVYDVNKPIDEPFNVLKTIFIIQSGFSIGLMIENWPKDCVPRYKKPL